jgi:DNA invertase Pin-like site-specific DNA recombinase
MSAKPQPKRVILYARLSITTDESVSVERQLQAGRDYCRARGWTVIAEHKDDGVSASANAPEHRKGWQDVLAHGRGTYDLVLVWKVDRLARKVLDFLNADKALQERGAAVAAVEDPVDMSTPQGRAFATLLAVFAEMEAESIRARVRAARHSLIKAGRVPGGAAPFGYRNADNPDGPGKVLAKDPDTIAFVIEAASRVLRGDSVNSVATYLDDVAPRTGRKNSAAHWTITVTKRMLSNPVLAGMTLHNPGNTGKLRGTEVLRDSDGMPIIREDLAVLSVEEFRTLEQRLQASEPYAARTESYLAGLVWCGECDRKMYRNAKTVHGRKVRVFQCQGKEGCGQQVTNLEGIVQERFLAEFGNHYGYTVVQQPTDYDHTEIDTQIAETMARMQDDDADVMALAERLQSLKALRRKVPPPQVRVVRSLTNSAEQWKHDPRAALLGQCDGVRLVKGGMGRNFDHKRLSWIQSDAERFESLGEALAASGMSLDEQAAYLAQLRESLQEAREEAAEPR